MKQAQDFESIIRQCQWHELNAEQKESIAAIAADEQAFNTAKRILLLASEETNKVPVLNPALGVALSDRLHKKQTIKPMFWYAAAASVVLAVAGLWLYKQPQRIDIPVVHDTPIQVPAISKDTVKIAEVPKVTQDSAVAAQLQTERIKQPMQPAPPVQAPQPSVSVAQNTSIAFTVNRNPEYLDLLTEMY